MLQLVRFGQGIHVYDTDQRRFVKSTARRIASALAQAGYTGGSSQLRTRKQMLQTVDWERCIGCKLGNPYARDRMGMRSHQHWLVKTDRSR